MSVLDPATNPLWLNGAIFLAAAIAIWLAGWRLSAVADVLSDRTRLGTAFLGFVLLGGVTALPEAATAATAAAYGDAGLATSTLLGGVAFHIFMLAIADAAAGTGPLTYFTPHPVIMLEGVLNILLLAVVAAAVVAGEVATVGGVGLWTALLFAGYILSVLQVRDYQSHEEWEPTGPLESPDPAEQRAVEREARLKRARRIRAHHRLEGASTARLAATMAGAALVIVAAGFALARTGAAAAAQTGVASSFLGLTLLAVAVSLPELTTTIAAVRMGRNSMAMSNVFGVNFMGLALLFLADVAYRRGPILEAAGASAGFAAVLAIGLTCTYLVGMIERRDQSVARLGVDSAIATALYVGGLAVLWALA